MECGKGLGSWNVVRVKGLWNVVRVYGHGMWLGSTGYGMWLRFRVMECG